MREKENRELIFFSIASLLFNNGWQPEAGRLPVGGTS